VDIYGRVGSLLEVGTGFHPELTGRENIFLNGAILGMRKKEVQRKFDEIVAFSAIEKFIDTPIKHYSSGMYVRLAFSVAAHLEPEILLVDEVLAVGDIEFQKRCLGKMEDVTSAGRTVLFVSHNMGLVQALCQRGIFLRNGRLSSDTSVTDAVKDYLRSFSQNMHLSLADRTDRVGNGEYRLTGLQILDSHQIDTRSIVSGGPVRFVFTVNEIVPRMFVSFTIYDFIGRAITRFQSSVASEVDVIDPQLGCQFICEIDHLFLTPGNYRLDVELRITGRLEDEIQSAATLDVHEGSYEGRRMLALKGVNTFIPHRWHSPLKYHNL
jgi:lipopolysaccharide transport system ATP-binding protein